MYQLAETNKELESKNATQVAIAADAKDRGRALLGDDSVRTDKRHNSKTRKSDTTNGPQQQTQVMLYQATMAASSSSVQAPNFLKPIDYSLGPGSVLFPVYQDPMIQAHIDQLHEAVGSFPNMRYGSTGNNGGGGGGHGDGGSPGLGYHNTDGSAGGLGCAPVPTAAGGPSPPDNDDDGDEDEEEPSDDDDDDRRRNRRSSRRRRSRDCGDHDSGRRRISRK